MFLKINHNILYKLIYAEIQKNNFPSERSIVYCFYRIGSDGTRSEDFTFSKLIYQVNIFLTKNTIVYILNYDTTQPIF